MLARAGTLQLLFVSLLWTAVNRAGVLSGPLYVTFILLGFALILANIGKSKLDPVAFPKWMRVCLLLLIAFVAFQFVPLPLWFLDVIDPHRAELQRALQPVISASWAPIAISIPSGMLWFATLLACVGLFFAVRALAQGYEARLWLLIAPLIGIGVLEAAIGLLQVGSGVDQATGTFNSRDHYGCFLEMIVPISVSCGLVLLQGRWRRAGPSILPSLGASICWVAAVVMLLAIFASLSRGATIAVLMALCLLAILEAAPRLRRGALRLTFIAVAAAGALLLLLFTAPGALQERFVGTLSTGSESRLDIWREALPIVKHYFLTGIGLTSFQSVFETYQRVAPQTVVNFAHNDYLQYFIELGLVGFALAIAFVCGVLVPVFRSAMADDVSAKRTWCTGCAASLAALIIHSAFDFNLYVPADVMLACWVAGFSYYVACAPAASAHRFPGRGVSRSAQAGASLHPATRSR